MAGFSAQARPGQSSENTVIREQIVIREVGYVLPDSLNTRSAGEARSLAPVADRLSRQRLSQARPTYSGIIPRLPTVAHPAELISPFAPREYGAAWNQALVIERDPYRTVTPYTVAPQTTGLRVLGVSGIW